tara:strand:+ start:160 stop:1218 length:1059 start_codon:yes stop_codon:yes gene_type:complete
MGILDKKTRFIDLVVTQEGKRQIAAGKLRAEFASLSDCNAFYDKAHKDDISQRLYFEVMERPENSIVLEKDDSGKLLNFNFSPTGSIVGDNIFLKDTSVAQKLSLRAATGSQFEVGQNAVLDTSLKHFKNNYFIGTVDRLKNDKFELTQKEMIYTINNAQPFGRSPYGETINVNNAEPFFLDPKLTHLPNFKYLPPTNTDGSAYGTFTDIRSTTKETWQDIKQRLGPQIFNEADTSTSTEDNNIKNNLSSRSQRKSRKILIDGQLPMITPPKKESKEIKFIKTSAENNLVIQMFEDSPGATMNKLDIVDAGIFTDDKDKNGRYQKRVFYIGKTFIDDFNTPTFVNIFTIIMD